MAEGWYCRRTSGGPREKEGGEQRWRRWRGGALRRKDEKRGKNIRKRRERDEDEMRKERKGAGWLALVFEFKYQTVRDRRGASGPQEPLQPENPRDSDTVFARN